MRSNNVKMKANKLTFRQYMAFSLIYSKYLAENKIPSISELKEVIGFKSDRMLNITLNALEKKGLIEYRQGKIKIKDEILNYSNLIDPLMVTKKYLTYNEIKKEVSKITGHRTNSTKKFNPKPIQLELSNDKDLIKYLNNEKEVFHRWYTFLEDYPPSLVYDKLKEFDVKKGSVVLDPFVGSGTTLVTSKLFGMNVIGIDANPVAAFVSKVKITWDIDLSKLKEFINKILEDYECALPLLEKIRLKTDFTESMGFIELHQWLKPRVQNEVAFLKERISEIEDSPEKDLLKLALIEAAVESSNVSFCPGTSFYPFRKRPAFIDSFKKKLEIVIEDLVVIQKLRMNDKLGEVESVIFNNDCRESTKYIDKSSIDFILTSPPYPNDLEYTRQTRLEMYLLDYVKDIKDVRKIKRRMVKGSTKLIFKDSNSEKYVKKFNSVQKVANQIARALQDRKWGWDYPRMVREYFGDMYLALKEFYELLKDEGYCLLVVGDQTYKKVLIPVAKILSEIGEDIGYSTQEIQLYRIRRSTIHNIPLPEEILVLRK
ncbi:hypothetical protein DRP07_09800 [Archaeoglobales archaeon]|nr:MAG: hypothetical protein DRP07_09800 [Archaeoglobales archaeon]